MSLSTNKRLPAVRVLILPGLHDSGPTHWQTWLQGHFRDAQRVEQDDFGRADIARWSARVEETLRAQPPGPWVAVAHSFGCLALAAHLRRHWAVPREGDDRHGIVGALMVAPARPERFPGSRAHVEHALGVPAVLLGSRNDPWMPADEARAWSQRWQTGFVDLGEAGHVNVDAGYGPLPPALHLTRVLIRHAEQSRRLARTDVRELSFAV